MKTPVYLIFLAILLILFSCQDNKEIGYAPKILIRGKVNLGEKKSNFTIFKQDIVSDESETFLISIDSSGYFEYSLDLNRPQTIFIGIYSNKNIPFFAFPDDTITFNISDELSVDFTNNSHEEFNNNLGLINDEIQRAVGLQLNPMSYKDLSEKQMKALLDSIDFELKSKIISLSEERKLNQQFKKYATLEIDFFLMTSLWDYEFFNENIFQQTKSIPFEDYWLIDTIVNNYNDFMQTERAVTFYNRIQLKYLGSDIEKSINKILKIDSSITRDILISREIYSFIADKEFNKAKKLIDDYSLLIGQDDLRLSINSKYETSLAIYNNPALASAKIKGLQSNYKTDIIDEITAEYKDKVLYIKFWAPYCGPCMAQLPYVKQLEGKINPDNFLVINICAPYPKDKWKATIKENNISGVHYLLNENQYNELKVLFNIQGIPRYVLIGKDGEIVNSDAPIPGDDILQGINYDLVSEIKNLINEK